MGKTQFTQKNVRKIHRFAQKSVGSAEKWDNGYRSVTTAPPGRTRPLWHRVLRQLRGREHRVGAGGGARAAQASLRPREALCPLLRVSVSHSPPGETPVPQPLLCPPEHARTAPPSHPKAGGGWAAPDAWVPGKGSRDFPMCY